MDQGRYVGNQLQRRGGGQIAVAGGCKAEAPAGQAVEGGRERVPRGLPAGQDGGGSGGSKQEAVSPMHASPSLAPDLHPPAAAALL